jgi:predicted nucleic acid-binding protein
MLGEALRTSTQVLQEFGVVVTRKVKTRLTSRFRFWDSLMLVIARQSGVKRLCTEDLQDGML